MQSKLHMTTPKRGGFNDYNKKMENDLELTSGKNQQYDPC
jgi:hypothetical protein